MIKIITLFASLYVIADCKLTCIGEHGDPVDM